MSRKRVAILQSNYIPWKGYFDLIAAVDEFILYDDVQFTKNDWRNRNRIKTPAGAEWISIPVGQAIDRKVSDVLLPAGPWRQKHWKMLEANYRRAPAFDQLASRIAPIYMDATIDHLSDWNAALINAVCAYLGIRTRIRWCWDYELVEGRVERLVSLCRQAGATTYVSGPSARSYLDPHVFAPHGIDVQWFDYAGYPEYPQLWGPFEHAVSVVDLLFNCGSESARFMKFSNKGS